MSNIVNLIPEKEIMIEYLVEDKVVIGLSSPDWTFNIIREGNEIGFFCKETDEPFGVLDRDTFNTILMSWLLIDDPNLLDIENKLDIVED